MSSLQRQNRTVPCTLAKHADSRIRGAAVRLPVVMARAGERNVPNICDSNRCAFIAGGADCSQPQPMSTTSFRTVATRLCSGIDQTGNRYAIRAIQSRQHLRMAVGRMLTGTHKRIVTGLRSRTDERACVTSRRPVVARSGALQSGFWTGRAVEISRDRAPATVGEPQFLFPQNSCFRNA